MSVVLKTVEVPDELDWREYGEYWKYYHKLCAMSLLKSTFFRGEMN